MSLALGLRSANVLCLLGFWLEYKIHKKVCIQCLNSESRLGRGGGDNVIWFILRSSGGSLGGPTISPVCINLCIH